MNFGQILTAMVTPFDQNGEIDFHATKNLINYLLGNGTEGLVVSGTTGESPTLTTEEKVELFKFVVKVVDGRVPVIAGTGSYNTRASINLTKLAEEAGVDGIMLVAPYYNKPSQEGLYQHFKAIANQQHYQSFFIIYQDEALLICLLRQLYDFQKFQISLPLKKQAAI